MVDREGSEGLGNNAHRLVKKGKVKQLPCNLHLHTDSETGIPPEDPGVSGF
jgi:hypothetical protein